MRNTRGSQGFKLSLLLLLIFRSEQISIPPKILTVLLLTIFSAFAVVPAQALDCDVVVLNGRVLDPETDFDAVRNVSIKDGSIVAITTKKIEGKMTIDATGHVVAPGFIDLHAHGQNIGDYPMQAMRPCRA